MNILKIYKQLSDTRDKDIIYKSTEGQNGIIPPVNISDNLCKRKAKLASNFQIMQTINYTNLTL